MIEELNEETTTINENTVTINGDIEDLGKNKQNIITTSDTLSFCKLKTQYIIMTITGQDLQTTLTSIETDVTDISDNRLSQVETNLHPSHTGVQSC